MKTISKIAAAGVGLLLAASSVFAQSLDDAKKAIDDEQYQKAKSMLKSLTAAQADKDENYFYLGWVYLKEDYIDSAKAVFNRGLAVNSSSALNLAGLGAAAHMEKDNAGATSNFNSAIALAGKKNSAPYIYVGLGWLLPVSGSSVGLNGPVVAPADANAAIAILTQGTVAYPRDARLLVALGDAYRSQLKSNAAYTAYQNALSIDPKSAAANVAEGVLLRFTDNFGDSQIQFEAALASDPDYSPAYREWAETDLRWARTDPALYNEKVKAAADNYKKYISLTDYSVESQMRYADFLVDSKDYVTLQKVAQDLTASEKSNLRAYRYLAIAAFENKDYPAGLAAMNKWVSQADPGRIIPADYLYLGRLQIALRNDSLGVIDLRKAISLDTTQVDLYGEIANSLYQLNKYQEAGDAYEIFSERSRQATLLDHYHAGISYFLAFGDQKDKRDKDNTFKLDSTLLIKADSAFTYVQRKAANPVAEAALYLAYINDYQEVDRNNIKGKAKPFYEQYIQLVLAKTPSPDDKTKVKLANAYAYLGNYAENKDKDEAKALDLYNKAKEMDPTNAQVIYFFAKKPQGKNR